MRERIQSSSRRQFLEQAGVACLGLNLGGLLTARDASPKALAVRQPIRSCILIFYYGGPSQIDTFDLKPNAPEEIRGEFKPIATSVPGLHVCEHLPRMSKLMHKAALIRSVTHAARLHDSAAIHALTGRPLEGPDRELFTPLPQVYPSYGSAVAYLRRNDLVDVPVATVPFPFRNVHEVPCQGAGFLGAAFDPIIVECDPANLCYRADSLLRGQELSSQRCGERQRLLAALDARQTFHPLREHYDRANRLLGSETIRRALDITLEPRTVRDRFGIGAGPATVGEGGGGGNGAELGVARQLRGQNLLMARRLVEAGVPFVNIHDFRQQGQNWDAHFKGANQHKSYLLPEADRSLSALIEDLDARGLLDSTLIVAMGEFGRTPKINRDAGRDHWPDCYTVLLAGGGVVGGAIHGASDRIAAYPARDPVTPGDIAATIFWRFGIDPSTEIHDRSGRPHRLATGEPLRRLFRDGVS